LLNRARPSRFSSALFSSFSCGIMAIFMLKNRAEIRFRASYTALICFHVCVVPATFAPQHRKSIATGL
jgi:hypothetical protein